MWNSPCRYHGHRNAGCAIIVQIFRVGSFTCRAWTNSPRLVRLLISRESSKWLNIVVLCKVRAPDGCRSAIFFDVPNYRFPRPAFLLVTSLRDFWIECSVFSFLVLCPARILSRPHLRCQCLSSSTIFIWRRAIEEQGLCVSL